MSKKLLLWAGLVLLPGYSFSNDIDPYYGQTVNAATGQTWSMDTVLPEPPGLDIQSIIYNYTIHKNTNDQVDVHVQNENALGTGYIFRETDTWLPGSLDGTQINKTVPVIPNIPKQAWGDGSIEVEGPGSISDPRVVYTYRVDPCYDPQYNPSCPGFVPPDMPEVDVDALYDATADSEISTFEDTANYSDDEELTDDEREERDVEEERDRKERLEKALSASNSVSMFAESLAVSIMFDTVNMATNINTYYDAVVPGGTYSESISLVDKQLPENRKGLRNGLAQQLLHEKMVESQY